jgi:hypothetical protein
MWVRVVHSKGVTNCPAEAPHDERGSHHDHNVPALDPLMTFHLADDILFKSITST